MKIYLVSQEVSYDDAIEILAVFAHYDDALRFKELLPAEAQYVSYAITERTLFYGQPPNVGWNS